MKCRIHILLPFFAVLLSLLISEMALRVFCPAHNRICVFPPLSHYQFLPDSHIVYGCTGIKNFDTDAWGCRIIPPKSESPEMLFVGGSATECMYLDNSETWPALLCAATGKTGCSIGKSGHTTIEHRLQLCYVLPQLKTVKKVVVLCGLNDMLKVLADTTRCAIAYDDREEQKLLQDKFTHTNRFASAQGWRLKSLLRNAYRTLQPDTTGQFQLYVSEKNYLLWRAHRAKATIFISDSNFAKAARKNGKIAYEKNLRAMIAAVKVLGKEIVFITQVAAWSDSMSASESKKLWMGGMGKYQLESGNPYYSTHFLQKELFAYNQITKKVCKELGITCIPADSLLPNPCRLFYDDCHFHEAGAKKMAALLQPFF